VGLPPRRHNLGGDVKRYFIWWVARPSEPNGGQWYGWRYLTDYEAFQEQLAIQTSTPDVSRLYRWIWDGSEWQYDTRPDGDLVTSGVHFAWL